jgi:hypothetical protein
VGAARGRAYFGDGAGTGSAVGGVGDSSKEIELTCLDEVLFSLSPTLIEIDIEGYEIEAIYGAREIISKKSPVLALCVYHRQDHLWRILLVVSAMNPTYRFILRSYCIDGWDLVLYAVPAARLIAPR